MDRGSIEVLVAGLGSGELSILPIALGCGLASRRRGFGRCYVVS